MNKIQELLRLNKESLKLCISGDRVGSELIDHKHNDIYDTLEDSEKNEYWKERERQYERR